MMKPNAVLSLTNHRTALTDHLYTTADAHRITAAAVDTLSALKDALEQLGMAAEGLLSQGKPLSAPDVILCVSVALSKIGEAHEVAGVQPVAVGEAAERLRGLAEA
ncbi:hypothetical protein [Tritonibacter mobilis]|uniref:hypothetical protein n=1 Tax=Tritonibacter mobilis TaxID=379347 RepID=UPI001CD9AA85|nr:hypothetical protein [Tritonibacter mobilis]MCA2008508.1 hypothetical protein [Tritonibacter mobilis]